MPPSLSLPRKGGEDVTGSAASVSTSPLPWGEGHAHWERERPRCVG